MNVDNQIIQAVKERKFEEAKSLAFSKPFTSKVLKFIADACQFNLLWDFYKEIPDSRRTFFSFVENSIGEGRVDVVDYLYGQKGLDPDTVLSDYFGETALMEACWHNQRDIVERLLNYDVDVEKLDNSGQNAFFYAVLSSDVNIFRLLFFRTGRIDYVDKNGHNLLHRICYPRVRSKEIFHDLLGFNVLDVNAQTGVGSTALHLLALWGNENPLLEYMMKTLLERPDIDLTIKNQKGETSWDVCQRFECSESIRQAFREKLHLEES